MAGTNDDMIEDSTPAEWVVEAGAPAFSRDIVEAARASHATLAEKLSALRSVTQPFPDSPGPAAARRWIERGGSPSAPGPPR